MTAYEDELNDKLDSKVYDAFRVKPVTQADMDAIGRRLKRGMMLSASYPFPEDLSYERVHKIHMAAGFEMGFLQVIDDVAYKKATNRQRTVVVYTTPEHRAILQAGK